MDEFGFFAILEIPNVGQQIRKTSELANSKRKLQLNVPCPMCE
jgi:hypothetical protein